MLYIFSNLYSLKVSQWMDVYSQSNQHDGQMHYPKLSASQQLLEAEQDHYRFLTEFYKAPGAICAVWEVQGRYEAAMRLEPYQDGYLLQGVETRPESRRRSYAYMLISEALNWLSKQNTSLVYSHIDRRNKASIALHLKCGFRQIMDYAVFIDGSVDQGYVTMVKNI